MNHLTPGDRSGNNPKSDVLERVARLCHRLPAAIVDSICVQLEHPTPGSERNPLATDLGSIRGSSEAAEVQALASAWLAANPESNLPQFSHLLRGAAAADKLARSGRDLELVWTGPTPANSLFRRTDQALLEVIDAAREELWIVSFASYKVPAISKALLEASKRGVKIKLVLESKEESDGKLTFSALKGLGSELADSASVYVWPRDRRERDGSGAQGALHAKCALADKEVLFVSSANLTEYAMKLNMELGVLIRGPALPDRTSEHLRWLVESGTLRRVSDA